MIEIYEITQDDYKKFIVRYDKKTKSYKNEGRFWFEIGSIMFAEVLDKNKKVVCYTACMLKNNYVQSYVIKKGTMKKIIKLKNDKENEYAINEIYHFFEQAMLFEDVKRLYA